MLMNVFLEHTIVIEMHVVSIKLEDSAVPVRTHFLEMDFLAHMRHNNNIIIKVFN